MSLFAFNRAAERVEQIADELRDIARARFDGRAARLTAEQRFSHIIDPSRPFTSEVNRLLDGDVRNAEGEFEAALEKRAFALVQELPEAEATLSKTFEEVRPRRDTSTSTAVMLSQERWESSKSLLKSGRSIDEAISIADLSGVLAIEAFAPGYLYAESTRGSLESPGGDLEQITRSIRVKVHARLAELADEATSEILRKVHRANGFTEIAWEYASHLNRRFTGSPADAMGTSVTVTYLRREYGIDKTPKQERAEQNAAASSETSRSLRRVEIWAQRQKTA